MSDEMETATEVVSDAPTETVEASPTIGETITQVEETPEPSWRDDWRDAMGSEDEKIAKTLSRYRSPEAVAKALHEAKTALRQKGPEVPKLSEDSSEDDVKAYREAMGVPESYEGYESGFSEGFETSEADVALLDGFKQAAHQANMTPEQVAGVTKWYEELAIAQQQDLNENEYETRVETQTTLKSEWGAEYDSNINAMNTFLSSQSETGEVKNVMELRLQDGSRLGDNMDFINMIIGPAIDHVGPNAIFSGDTEQTSMDLEGRKDEILKMSLEDPAKYKSKPIQSELQSIYQKLEKLGNR